MPRSLLALLAFTVLALPATAAPLEPTLGRKGRLLLDEKFERNAVPAGWRNNRGDLTVQSGSLHLSERASDKHLAALGKALPLQDCAIQLDLKFENATAFHLGFNPAKGALKKKGHLFSVVITPEAWQIMEHVDKSDPQSKNQVHTRAAARLSKSRWVTLLLEVRGNDVVAHLSGREPLRATAKDFHVKKPGFILRVGGKGEHAALIDNVKIWELLPDKK